VSEAAAKTIRSTIRLVRPFRVAIARLLAKKTSAADEKNIRPLRFAFRFDV
jgi:hypothetical protein